MNRLIPFDAIKDDFICGIERDGVRWYPSIGELARRYKCAYSTIANHCSQEKWIKQRTEYQVVLQQKITEARRNKDEQFIIKAGEFDVLCAQISVMGLEQIKAAHRFANKEERIMEQGKNEALARATAAYQKIGRLALGMPSDNNKLDNIVKQEGIDLSKLTNKELGILEKIAERAEERERKRGERKQPL